MKIASLNSHKVTARTFIQALGSTALIIWVIAYTYIVSSKSSPLVYDYAKNLLAEEDNINRKTSALIKVDPCSEQVLSLCRLLCQIKLCRKEPQLIKEDLPALFSIANRAVTNHYPSDLDLFGANIYREYGEYKTAQVLYSHYLSSLSKFVPGDTQNFQKNDFQACKARGLNNKGIVYFLSAKTTANKEESCKNYLLARSFFQRAKDALSGGSNICLAQTIESNIQECLTELKYIN